MAKAKKQGGKRIGNGRKSLPVGEKVEQITVAVYRKKSEKDILKQNNEKFKALKHSVSQSLNEGIENILLENKI